MRLSEAGAGEIVRNRRNKNFYRFVRPEEDRIRIRPLEVFPNGLLIEKSADTIVEADLEVDRIGQWHDEFFIDIPELTALWPRYESEYSAKRRELDELLESEETSTLPKGSFVNKVLAVRRRIECLERGLSDPNTRPVKLRPVKEKAQKPKWSPEDQVQLPSGVCGVVVGMVNTKKVQVRAGSTQFAVASHILTPLRQRYIAAC